MNNDDRIEIEKFFVKAMAGPFAEQADYVDVIATSHGMNRIFNFMNTLFFNIHIKSVSDNLALKRTLRSNGVHDESDAVLFADTIFVHSSLRDAFLLVKEYLHPFVTMLHNEYQDFFTAMYEKAIRNLKTLDCREFIEDSYFPPIDEEEIVGRSLAGHLLLSFGKRRKYHNSYKHFLSHYVLFEEDIMGYESIHTFEKTNIGTFLIPINALTNLHDLSCLADALNTYGITIRM